MKKVLHYKTNFLNKSETFIDRLIRNHKTFTPFGLCYRPRFFTDGFPLYSVPGKGIAQWINIAAFRMNAPLPFYYKTIKKIQPDVIHAHFGFDAVKLMRITNSLNIPLVVSFYGSDVSRLPSEFGWRRRYRKLAQHGTRFIAASQVMKESLIKLGFPEEKIRIVRFGVNLDIASFRKEYLSSPTMMMVGRMVEKKGFEYAIHAVSELLKRGIRIELNLYGDGPLIRSLQQLTVSLHLESQVQFHGYQPIENILDAHNDHSILLAPSVTAQDGDMEGLPNTILEAMARGTPVVATHHAAIPEVIEHEISGFLIEERNLNELTNILEAILKGGYNLETIRKNARSVVENLYCVNGMVTDIEQIYHEVTGLSYKHNSIMPDSASRNTANSDILLSQESESLSV